MNSRRCPFCFAEITTTLEAHYPTCPARPAVESGITDTRIRVVSAAALVPVSRQITKRYQIAVTTGLANPQGATIPGYDPIARPALVDTFALWEYALAQRRGTPCSRTEALAEYALDVQLLQGAGIASSTGDASDISRTPGYQQHLRNSHTLWKQGVLALAGTNTFNTPVFRLIENSPAAAEFRQQFFDAAESAAPGSGIGAVVDLSAALPGAATGAGLPAASTGPGDGDGDGIQDDEARRQWREILLQIAAESQESQGPGEQQQTDQTTDPTDDGDQGGESDQGNDSGKGGAA